MSNLNRSFRRAVRVSGPWSAPVVVLLWLRVVFDLIRLGLVVVVLALLAFALGVVP